MCSLYRWIRCWCSDYCQVRDSSVVSILNYPNDMWVLPVVLFDKVVELSGGGALLEKVAQYWVGLEVF